MYEYKVLKGKAEFIHDWVMLNSLIEVTYLKKYKFLLKFACFFDEPEFVSKDTYVEYVNRKNDCKYIKHPKGLLSVNHFIQHYIDREELFWHTKDYIFPEIKKYLKEHDELNDLRLFLLPL